MAFEKFKSNISKPSFFSNRVQVMALSFAALLNGCIEHVSPTQDPVEMVAGYQGDLLVPGNPDAQMPEDQEIFDVGFPDTTMPIDTGIPQVQDITDLEMPDSEMPVDAQMPEELDFQMPEELDFQMPEELDFQMPEEFDAEMPLDQGVPIPEPRCEVAVTILDNPWRYFMQDEQLLFSFSVEPFACDLSFESFHLVIQDPSGVGLQPNATLADYLDWVRISHEVDGNIIDEDGVVVFDAHIDGLYFDCFRDQVNVFHVRIDLPFKYVRDFDYTTNINGQFSFIQILPNFEDSFENIRTGEEPYVRPLVNADLSFADLPVLLSAMFANPVVEGNSLDADVELLFWQQVREELDFPQFADVTLNSLQFTYSTHNASIQSISLVDALGANVEGQLDGESVVFAFDQLELLDVDSVHLRLNYLPEDFEGAPFVLLSLVQGTYSVNDGIAIPLNPHSESVIDEVRIHVNF